MNRKFPVAAFPTFHKIVASPALSSFFSFFSYRSPSASLLSSLKSFFPSRLRLLFLFYLGIGSSLSLHATSTPTTPDDPSSEQISQQKRSLIDPPKLSTTIPSPKNTNNIERNSGTPAVILHPELIVDERENIPNRAEIIFTPGEAQPAAIHQPKWLSGKIIIDPPSGSVEVPLPPIYEQSNIESFFATINFDDHGDGGPFLYWKKKDGSTQLLAGGLGINGCAVGHNTRTITLPSDLTLDGGSLLLTHIGRFEQLKKIVIQPAQTVSLNTLSTKSDPLLLDEADNVYQQEELQGEGKEPEGGDFSEAHYITAELSAKTEEIEEAISFSFEFSQDGPLPDGSCLRTEINGLDLGSEVELIVNDIPIGTLNIEEAALSSPRWEHHNGTIQLLGWRSTSRYIPPSVWKPGVENHLLLHVVKGPLSSSNSTETSKIYLKKSYLELSFPTAASPQAPRTRVDSAQEKQALIGKAPAEKEPNMRTSPALIL